VLTLETLLWPDEVRSPDFAFLDENVEVRSQELKMAASLIDTMTEDFDPSLYRDAYREALESLVQAKIEGNEVVRPAGTSVAPDKGTGPLDLTETLRASVEAAKATRAGGSARNAEADKPSRGGGSAKKTEAGKAARGGGSAKSAADPASGGTTPDADSVPAPRPKPKPAPRRRASA